MFDMDTCTCTPETHIDTVNGLELLTMVRYIVSPAHPTLNAESLAADFFDAAVGPTFRQPGRVPVLHGRLESPTGPITITDGAGPVVTLLMAIAMGRILIDDMQEQGRCDEFDGILHAFDATGYHPRIGFSGDAAADALLLLLCEHPLTAPQIHLDPAGTAYGMVEFANTTLTCDLAEETQTPETTQCYLWRLLHKARIELHLIT